MEKPRLEEEGQGVGAHLGINSCDLERVTRLMGLASPAVTWGPGLQPAGSLGHSFLIFVLFTYSHNFIN